MTIAARNVLSLSLLSLSLAAIGLGAVSCNSSPQATAPTPQATPAAAVARPAFVEPSTTAYSLKSHYNKQIHRIPMRDGVHLMTIVLTPKDTSRTYPILMNRTPYSIGPYGENEFPDAQGSLAAFASDGFILVRQDVRGRYMSEGTFVNMTPHKENKSGQSDIDESTDTFDTVDWLVKNVPGNNGRVGQWGVSYPGFYSSAGMIDAHPALKAVSPQAPIADWFFDDFYHHGAFFLPHFFGFFYGFGTERPAPVSGGWRAFNWPTPDGYRFFLDMGPMSNIDAQHYKGTVAFWNDIVAHPTYDAFWQSRNILPHLKNVAPSVMTVGGWFDAEDLYGAINTYQAIEKQNPSIYNILVMGPWGHGDWSRRDGSVHGDLTFGTGISGSYQQNIELPFFRAALKDGVSPKLPEAYIFDTGANQWRTFDHWPPKETGERPLYFQPGRRLAFDVPPAIAAAADTFVSDPAIPVPYTEHVSTGMVREYMSEDQRFASRRPDVLVYQTEPLATDMTLAGPITAELFVSTTGTDADWVVKLIDVFPGDAKENLAPQVPSAMNPMRKLGDYQMMVRSEVIRGRYRNSYSAPEPFTPGAVTAVKLPLQDVLHTFKAGHRIMVQVQSTWFPLVDRNPQKYVPNIFKATPEDFIKATHSVHRSPASASRLRVGVLP